jgi:hypothetical protein
MTTIYTQFLLLFRVVDIWALTNWFVRRTAALYKLQKLIAFDGIAKNEWIMNKERNKRKRKETCKSIMLFSWKIIEDVKVLIWSEPQTELRCQFGLLNFEQ